MIPLPPYRPIIVIVTIPSVLKAVIIETPLMMMAMMVSGSVIHIIIIQVPTLMLVMSLIRFLSLSFVLCLLMLLKLICRPCTHERPTNICHCSAMDLMAQERSCPSTDKFSAQTTMLAVVVPVGSEEVG
jgi:hypothetical protein